MSVIGKRREQRTVPVSHATVAALRAHWRDRSHNFDDPDARGPLIAPLWIPATRTARERHDANSDKTDEKEDVPYTVDALGRLVRGRCNASAPIRRTCSGTTFGTRAVAREMHTDVVQAILGHASLQTTSIYVRAERRRMLEAAARYYAENER